MINIFDSRSMNWKSRNLAESEMFASSRSFCLATVSVARDYLRCRSNGAIEHCERGTERNGKERNRFIASSLMLRLLQLYVRNYITINNLRHDGFLNGLTAVITLLLRIAKKAAGRALPRIPHPSPPPSPSPLCARRPRSSHFSTHVYRLVLS